MNDKLEVKNVEADKKRPWKALVPIVIGVLYTVIEAIQVAYDDNAWDKNDTFTVVLLALSAVMAYFVPNPIVRKT